MKKLDYIDALRGVAILGVLMVHTSQYGRFNVNNTVGKMIAEGARGVQLFYIASAFTLFLSFKNRLTKEKSPIRNFFLRRFFRIAPMYYLGIAYYLFQDGFGPRYFLGDAQQITVLNIISNCTFLHGFNPYWITSTVPGGWSIAVEMTFYAILPFLFFRIKNLNQAFIFFLGSTLISFFLELIFSKYQLISDNELWTNYLFLYFPNQLPVFALGMMFYFMVMESESITSISGKSLLLFSILLLGQLVLGQQVIFRNHIFFGMGFLVLGLALSRFRFVLIVNPIIKFIGTISFSMYLVHFAVLNWLTYFNFIDYFNSAIGNYITRYFIVSILTIAISTVLYKCVELPFQGLSKKIISKLERKQAISEILLEK